ncbi:zinc finger BED domain-containing protein RICESLEEPER 2-like protein [Tanacetum coccineum]|uniref:Zinc finger BED domain-containing protein RICESLEEPER 2-like protein n=1 Tax=Tanacetum coccineum TaxID=301880 RepID=A0ABQ4YS67_9ASTR
MASESASTTTGVGSTSALTIREIIPTNRTPEVWKDFNMCIMTNGQKKAQCKYCFHFLSEGSNTTLKNHITHPHCEVLKAQQNQNPEAGQTSMGRDGQIFMYNPDYLREQFAGLVIQRGLPFNHFDHEQTTRVFQNTMQPRYTHVSRSTLKRDAMKLWVAAKQATIDGFANLNTRVNLTTDVWSAPHNLPGSYMCVTAHWIEPSTWQMMKRVISFEEFPSPHTGTNLKYMLEKVFVIYGLQEKIMSITLDNASNNTSAMEKLILKYNPPMAGRFYHSRCVAHIINLVVQAGLKVPIINQMKESFKQMLKDVFKSGDKIRKRYIRICRDADKPCYSPNWDVDTRWNSTFEMFESGLKQKTTLAYFHDILVNKNENLVGLRIQDDRFATGMDRFHESFKPSESPFSNSGLVIDNSKNKTLTPEVFRVVHVLEGSLRRSETFSWKDLERCLGTFKEDKDQEMGSGDLGTLAENLVESTYVSPIVEESFEIRESYICFIDFMLLLIISGLIRIEIWGGSLVEVVSGAVVPARTRGGSGAGLGATRPT